MTPSTDSLILQKPSSLLVVGFLLAVSLPVFLLGLGSYGMLDPTDSFFVEGPKEMLERGHYLTPLFNYTDWFDKPAFPFLLIVLSYKIFGVSAWAARLPSALSGVALVLLTAVAIRSIVGARAAWLCGLVLAACPIFVIVGRCALTDEPLTLLIGASLLAFARALILSDRVAALCGYFALALAIVCKGPIGLVLVFGSIVTYASLDWWHRKRNLANLQPREALPHLMATLRPVAGALILLFAACPYFIIAHFTTNGAFTNEFFFHQNLGRFEGTVNHQQPVWWYIPVFFCGYLPWTVFLMAGLPYIKRLWLKRTWTHRQRLMIFSISWLAFVLVLFSFVPTKLPTYIVPLSPALAILVGLYLDFLVRIRGRKALIAFSLCILAAASAPLAVLSKLLHEVPESASVIVGNSIMLFAFVLLQIRAIRRSRLRQALIGQLLCVLLIIMTAVPAGFRYYYTSHQKNIDDLVALAKEKNANLATLFNSVPSAIFAFDHPILMLQSLQEVEQFAESGPSPHWLLATENCMQIEELRAKDRLIAHEGKWYLLSVEHFMLLKSKP
jgi:4-amino-4-deoxy-L-arabinose transferase-like glycosyltransferase